MKYLFLLATLAAGYYLLARETPLSEVSDTLAETKAAPNISPNSASSAGTSGTNAFNRTHAALDRVKQRNAAADVD